MIFSFCVPFTNLNIKLQPLRNADGDLYKRYINVIVTESRKAQKRQNETQTRYRWNRKKRLRVRYGTNILNTSDVLVFRKYTLAKSYKM